MTTSNTDKDKPRIRVKSPNCQDDLHVPDFGFMRCQDSSGQRHRHWAVRQWNGKRVRLEWVDAR
jgi:hypothetical protein